MVGVIFVVVILLFHAWVIPGGLTYADLLIPVIFLFITLHSVKKNVSGRLLFVVIIMALTYDIGISLVNGYEYNILSSIKKIISYCTLVGSAFFIGSISKTYTPSYLQLFLISVLLSFLRIFNITPFGASYYEMPGNGPFFDSIDVALVFLMLQSAFLTLQSNLKNKRISDNLWIFSSAILCGFNVAQSGSRTSIFIWMVLLYIYFFKNIKMIKIFSGSTIVITVAYLLDTNNLSILISEKSIGLYEAIASAKWEQLIEYVIFDSSMQVRIENSKAVLDNIGIFQLIFGLGANNWRIFIEAENRALDNSYLVAIFDYGLIGLISIIFILRIFLNKFGPYFSLTIGLFILVQDLLSNSISLSVIITAMFLCIAKKNNHDSQKSIAMNCKI